MPVLFGTSTQCFIALRHTCASGDILAPVGGQFACYSGVAPFEYQSGTSIRGRTKVSNFAQKKLKSLLNLGALSAKRHDVELKNYFERKVAEGKNKMLVVNAIRCKILARAFAVINRGTPFVNTQKFAAY